MQLINILKTGETYQINALHTVKLLGVNLFSRSRSYSFSEENNEWYEIKSGKRISSQAEIKLNKWLKDHQKFIEKT